MIDGEVSGLTGLMRQLLGVGVSLKLRSGQKRRVETEPYCDSLLKGHLIYLSAEHL